MNLNERFHHVVEGSWKVLRSLGSVIPPRHKRTYYKHPPHCASNRTQRPQRDPHSSKPQATLKLTLTFQSVNLKAKSPKMKQQ
jgi:hypothetical protein